MKHILLLLLAFPQLLFAQQHCGTDEMHQRLFQQHPEYNAGIRNAHDRLEAFTSAYVASPPKSGATYIIPVVFHIIHNYGAENISDAQIHDAIEQVNLQFRKLNPDTGEIMAPFQSIAADAEIEIRLAQLDPNGNCTSGITRTASLLTYEGDHAVKSLVQWPPDKYLNIYVCVEAAGLAGHSLMPAAADTIPQWDGIVMQHSYVGTIGTSDYFRRTVLTHEIGHYLNLYHIWGGNNVPDYPYLPVGDAGNCSYDDEVTDTPNTLGWQTCNLNGHTCGSPLDNVQNYMDYAYCARMFTEGQKLRMHAALNSTVANRNNLWQPANLAATGTDDLTYYICAAKFEAERRVICAGETVEFTDLSYHGITARSWEFEGGTAASLTDETTSVTYPAAGTFDVLLKAGNGTDTVELLIPDYMTVLPAAGGAVGLTEDFESETAFAMQWIVPDAGMPTTWEFAPVGYASAQSFMVTNSPAELSHTFEFHSQPVDASGYSTLAVAFDWAFAQRMSTDADILRVMTSANCGDTWQVKKTYFGHTTLPSINDTLTTPFLPADETEWNSDTVLISGAATMVDNLLVKFLFLSKGGNNFYIDNIRIGHPDALGLGIEAELQPQVFPNPSGDAATLTWNGSVAVSEIEVMNVAGEVLRAQRPLCGESTMQLDFGNIPAGWYVIVLNVKGRIVRLPHVIVR
jgi:PKD repeat protein